MLEQYEQYADTHYSGEQWLGDVPKDWNIEKLKYLFSEKRHTQNLDLQCGSISFGEVITKDDEKVPLSTKASYQEVLAGEFLVNPLNLNYDLKSLRIALSKLNVVVSAGYIVLDAKPRLNKQYYKYLMHQYDVAYMKLLGSGVRQTISFNHISNSLLPFPPPEVQTAIASFLDDKTEKIDRAIEIKEAQIAGLQERKQILIQTAVTRGLDPNVPMKDSGIDWIGEIPENWNIVKLKFLGEFISGFSFDSNSFTLEGVRVLKISNIQTMNIDWTDESYVTEEMYERHPKFRVFDGDLVFALTRPFISTGLKAAIVNGSDKILINQRNAIFRQFREKMTKKFLYYTIFSNYFISDFLPRIEITGQQPNISTFDISNISIVLPPPQEQSKITDFLEIENKKIGEAINLNKGQIFNLKEYRASLINAAVTGKIKVPR